MEERQEKLLELIAFWKAHSDKGFLSEKGEIYLKSLQDTYRMLYPKKEEDPVEEVVEEEEDLEVPEVPKEE